jgi:hypothetical protein
VEKERDEDGGKGARRGVEKERDEDGGKGARRGVEKESVGTGQESITSVDDARSFHHWCQVFAEEIRACINNPDTHVPKFLWEDGDNDQGIDNDQVADEGHDEREARSSRRRRKEGLRSACLSPPVSSHINFFGRVAYRAQLDAWLEYFPPSQLLVLSAERFFAEPTTVLAVVEEFLGLTPHKYELSVLANKWQGPGNNGASVSAAENDLEPSLGQHGPRSESEPRSAIMANGAKSFDDSNGTEKGRASCDQQQRQQAEMIRLAETALHEGIREFNLSYMAFFEYALAVEGLQVVAR